jgi:hypothetical protein
MLVLTRHAGHVEAGGKGMACLGLLVIEVSRVDHVRSGGGSHTWMLVVDKEQGHSKNIKNDVSVGASECTRHWVKMQSLFKTQTSQQAEPLCTKGSQQSAEDSWSTLVEDSQIKPISAQLHVSSN